MPKKHGLATWNLAMGGALLLLTAVAALIVCSSTSGKAHAQEMRAQSVPSTQELATEVSLARPDDVFALSSGLSSVPSGPFGAVAAQATASVWETETVDSAGYAGQYTSLALDVLDRPHVSYAESIDDELRYAYYDGTAWITETVDSTGWGYTSLALDENDLPHISYYSVDQGDLKHAYYDGATWISETVDSSGNVGQYTSLALDADDHPHISYHNVDDRDLKYAYFDGSAWISETVDSSGNVGHHTSLALDADNRPHVSYSRLDTPSIRYAQYTGSIWISETVASGVGETPYVSLALDALDDAHIAYYDSGSLMYIHWISPTWISETVDSGTVGQHPSLALDSVGEPHVSYYDETSHDLIYAQHDLTPPTITSGPTVVVLSSSAVVSWETDEDSTSRVRYGKQAGSYDWKEIDSTLVQSHSITLTSLQWSTVYHYQVGSADAAGNTVISEEGFFRTAPPGDDPSGPTVSSPAITGGTGGFEHYTITASASDNYGIERIEFFMDGELIGIDYSASSPYQTFLVPSYEGMDRDEFYSGHVIAAAAYDVNGKSVVSSVDFTPLPKVVPINVSIMSPVPEHTIYFDGALAPSPTLVDVEVYAYEWEWLSPPAECPSHLPGIYCTSHPLQVRHAVTVTFSIDDAPVYTSYPISNLHWIHTYSWNASGSAPGTYTVKATAQASDGTTRYDERQVTLAHAEPELELRRDVYRYGNFFQISLEILNEGAIPVWLDRIEDTLDGFQAIRRQATDYVVDTDYSKWTEQCAVEIDLFTGNSSIIELGPGESHSVAYYAVPIKRVSSATPAIGAEVVRVHYIRQSSLATKEFPRPCIAVVSPDGQEGFSDSVDQAFRSADYMIVTNPTLLEAVDINYGHIQNLLSTMAELARYKNGILGYVDLAPNNYTWQWVDDYIELWGSDMRGSDGIPGHYLSNGYLLLVGETEILPAQTKQMNPPSYAPSASSLHITETDMRYANTAGNAFNPELMVGRIIGDDSQQLAIPIQTSINVHRGDPWFGFDRSSALLASGFARGPSDNSDAINFPAEIEDVHRILDDRGTYDFGLLHTPDYVTTSLREGAFLSLAANRDIIHLAGHGSETSWDDIGRSVVSNAPDPFGDTNPFVYASSCLTGRYAGHDSLAEAFLERGAGAYLGSTATSFCCTNKNVARKFYDWWDPGESIGFALKQLKTDIGSGVAGASGYYEDIWTAEYHLFGDPTYGEGAYPGPLSQATGTVWAASGPASLLDITVPAYEITTTLEGHDLVQIPGGFTVMVPDKPLVPLYDVSIDYPPGYRVQDVVLTDRSGLSVTTGLNIPNFTPAVAGNACGVSSQSSSAGEWWPEGHFDWSIRESGVGTTTLAIRVYPFYYNALTTDVRFYQNYSFDIDYITTTVEISLLATDEHIYSQGDAITVDLWIENTGDAQDVIVDAVVRAESSGEIVDGLLLQSLQHLTGLASFTAQWDSSGFEPGYYFVEAVVRDLDGSVLDTEIEEFRLGIYSGQIVTLSTDVEVFDVGDTVSTSLVFSNTGTVALTGTTVIQVQAEGSGVVREFRHDFSGAAPGSSIGVDEDWDTLGTQEGFSYRIVGYALYDAKSTPPKTVTVRSKTHLYLPVVMRNASAQ